MPEVAGMDQEQFVSRFGMIYEHSPWVAEAAFSQLSRAPGDPGLNEIAAAMRHAMRSSSRDAQRKLICAHPDLAGRLAMARRLTKDSTNEQASAGLDQLTAEEHQQFCELNSAYRDKFGFPFIMAVAGRNKEQILAAFADRLENSVEEEFERALDEIDRIARMRMEKNWSELSR